MGASIFDAGGECMGYTIKQVAQMCNMPQSTLRYYTNLGILPCTRDAGNRRVFDDQSLSRLRTIRCLRNCGMSMQDIQRYCDLCAQQGTQALLYARYQMILQQRDNAYARLKEAQELVDFVEQKIAHYQTMLPEAEGGGSATGMGEEPLSERAHLPKPGHTAAL